MNDNSEISSNLTLADLKVINNIIEGVSSKGLIKPNEFSLIGSIYEKINSLLKQVEDASKDK
jgi:hypothetical protein